MIKLQNVLKEYALGKEKLTVLKNITLEIKEGEFAAVVGPSGSGKSTLLHLIGALDKPTSGTVEVFGADLSNFSDQQASRYRNQTVGFVFQSFNLISNLNALENVSLPLIYREEKVKDVAIVAKEALRKMGLEHRLKHKPTEISGGEAQRISIARAIVNQPKIILADEPTGNLDTKTGEQIIAVLRKLNRDGITLIVVTHNEQIAKEADRVIRLQDGRILND